MRLLLSFILIFAPPNGATTPIHADSSEISAAFQGMNLLLHPEMPEVQEKQLADAYLDGPRSYCADSKIGSLKSSAQGQMVLRYCKNLRAYLTVKKVFKRCGLGRIKTEGDLAMRILANIGTVNDQRLNMMDCSQISSLKENIVALTEPAKYVNLSYLQDEIYKNAAKSGREQLDFYQRQFPAGRAGEANVPEVIENLNGYVYQMNNRAEGARAPLKPSLLGAGPDLNNEFMDSYGRYGAAYADAVTSPYGLLFQAKTMNLHVGDYRRLSTGLGGAGLGGGLAQVRTRTGRVEYALKRHEMVLSGEAGRRMILQSAEETKAIIRDEIRLLDDMNSAKQNEERNGIKNVDRRYSDLKNLFRTNPAHVATALIDHPELAYYACSILEAIRIQEESKQASDRFWNRTFLIGGIAAITVLTAGVGLAAAGTVTGAAVLGSSATAVTTGLATAMTVAGTAATVAGGAGVVRSAYDGYAAYGSYQRYRGSLATSGADAQTVREMNAEWDRVNAAVGELALNGVITAAGAAGAIRAAGLASTGGPANVKAAFQRLNGMFRFIKEGGGTQGFDEAWSKIDDVGKLWHRLKDAPRDVIQKFVKLMQQTKSAEKIRAMRERFNAYFRGCA
ncbi:MAG: hypothetical protein ABL958_07520 [Bdellovibrionia bacterium]